MTARHYQNTATNRSHAIAYEQVFGHTGARLCAIHGSRVRSLAVSSVAIEVTLEMDIRIRIVAIGVGTPRRVEWAQTMLCCFG